MTELNLTRLAIEANARLEKMVGYEDKAANMRVSAGEILFQAKQEVLRRRKEEEDFDTSWKDWVEQNINRSYSDVNKCIKLLQSPDPEKAQERERERNREDQAKKREKDKSLIDKVKTSDFDPTVNGSDSEPDKVDTNFNDVNNSIEDSIESKKDEEKDIIDEVNDIKDAQYDRQQAVAMIYSWIRNHADLDELNHIISYYDVPEIPEVLKTVEKHIESNNENSEETFNKINNENDYDENSTRISDELPNEEDLSIPDFLKRG